MGKEFTPEEKGLICSLLNARITYLQKVQTKNKLELQKINTDNEYKQYVNSMIQADQERINNCNSIINKILTKE